MRYFIDVVDGSFVHNDTVGSVVESLTQARFEAVEALIELLRHRVSQRDEHVIQARVRTDEGTIVYEARVSFESQYDIAI